MSVLYDRIETLCKKNNKSITSMCKESGASRASLTDLKSGRNNGLSAETLSKIGTYFGVSVDFLLGKEEKPTVQDDGLSKEKQDLIQAIMDLPEDKVLLLLQVARSIR